MLRSRPAGSSPTKTDPVAISVGLLTMRTTPSCLRIGGSKSEHDALLGSDADDRPAAKPALRSTGWSEWRSDSAPFPHDARLRARAKHRLTFYDAVYLELAHARLALATWTATRGAPSEGVLWPPDCMITCPLLPPPPACRIRRHRRGRGRVRPAHRSARYYDGPVSDHFDGTRFFDPHSSPPKSLATAAALVPRARKGRMAGTGRRAHTATRRPRASTAPNGASPMWATRAGCCRPRG